MGIDYLTPADRYYGLKQDSEKIVNTSCDDNNELYLAGRIEGQPIRAKENKEGKIDLFLAGKKVNTIGNKNKLKKVFALD